MCQVIVVKKRPEPERTLNSSGTKAAAGTIAGENCIRTAAQGIIRF
jgi:hypothetical protein